MAWANSEPTQHLARYSDEIKLEKAHIRVFWQRLVDLQKWDMALERMSLLVQMMIFLC